MNEWQVQEEEVNVHESGWVRREKLNAVSLLRRIALSHSSAAVTDGEVQSLVTGVSALSAVDFTLTSNPKTTHSSRQLLCLIAWWGETKETWLALSCGQTPVCEMIGNRSRQETNEDLFVARAGRPYLLGVLALQAMEARSHLPRSRQSEHQTHEADRERPGQHRDHVRLDFVLRHRPNSLIQSWQRVKKSDCLSKAICVCGLEIHFSRL